MTATGIDTTLDHRQIRVFDGVTGPFAVKGGIDVQFSERALRIEPIDSRLAFDGSNVSMQELPIVTSMGPLSLSGRVNRVLDTMSLELEFEGPIDVAQAASWAPPPMPVSGTVRVQGTLNGPLKTLDTVVRVDTDALAAGDERGLALSGEFVIDRQRLTSNRIAASPASGGQVNAAIDIPFGDAPFTANANWQGVDARVFLRVNELDPLAIGTRLDGTAQYTSGPRRGLVVKADATALSEPGVTPLAGRIQANIDGDRLTVEHALRADGVDGQRHRDHPHRQRRVPPVHARRAVARDGGQPGRRRSRARAPWRARAGVRARPGRGAGRRRRAVGHGGRARRHGARPRGRPRPARAWRLGGDGRSGCQHPRRDGGAVHHPPRHHGGRGRGRPSISTPARWPARPTPPPATRASCRTRCPRRGAWPAH